jgi:hypothetical protein
MDVVTKATASVAPVEDSKSKHGEFDVILSTSSLDRDGDELHPDEWKTPLPERITFDSDHGMSVATCVGSGKPFINDQGQLQVRGTFASTPHGQAVRTLVNEGHISSVSVAFMNHKTQKSGKPVRELLNGAFVAVPANPEARVLASKMAESITRPISDEDKALLMGNQKDAPNWRDNQMDAVTDMFENDPSDGGNQPERKEYWQGVHDVAVKLGAGCPYSDPQAIPGVLNGQGNRSAHGAETKHVLDQATHSNVDEEASPTESAETEAAAADEESAAAAEESADDVALLAKKLATQLEANAATALNL